MAVQSVTCPPVPAAFLITEKRLAHDVSLSLPMLRKLRREGRGPAYLRIGSAIRYPIAAVNEWLAELATQS